MSQKIEGSDNLEIEASTSDSWPLADLGLLNTLTGYKCVLPFVSVMYIKLWIFMLLP